MLNNESHYFLLSYFTRDNVSGFNLESSTYHNPGLATLLRVFQTGLLRETGTVDRTSPIFPDPIAHVMAKHFALTGRHSRSVVVTGYLHDSLAQ